MQILFFIANQGLMNYLNLRQSQCLLTKAILKGLSNEHLEQIFFLS
jgi:hypothetical protein